MIRVALLADTHGQLDARIGDLVRVCDIAVHGGDIGNADILARLQPRSGHVYAVRGNNDVPRKWPEGDRILLERLPEQAVVELPGGSLVILHGHHLAAAGRHARLRREHPHARAIVYGHSHLLVADRETSPWVLNPGAAGRARSYGGPSCLILAATNSDWHLDIHRFALADTRRSRVPRRVRQPDAAGEVDP
ncbi:MAG: metallophosphoesterase family protein [Thiohalocapsa sp.]